MSLATTGTINKKWGDQMIEKHYKSKCVRLCLVDEILMPDHCIALLLYADTNQYKSCKANYYVNSVSMINNEVDLLIENATLEEAEQEFNSFKDIWL